MSHDTYVSSTPGITMNAGYDKNILRPGVPLIRNASISKLMRTVPTIAASSHGTGTTRDRNSSRLHPVRLFNRTFSVRTFQGALELHDNPREFEKIKRSLNVLVPEHFDLSKTITKQSIQAKMAFEKAFCNMHHTIFRVSEFEQRDRLWHIYGYVSRIFIKIRTRLGLTRSATMIESMKARCELRGDADALDVLSANEDKAIITSGTPLFNKHFLDSLFQEALHLKGNPTEFERVKRSLKESALRHLKPGRSFQKQSRDARESFDDEVCIAHPTLFRMSEPFQYMHAFVSRYIKCCMPRSGLDGESRTLTASASGVSCDAMAEDLVDHYKVAENPVFEKSRFSFARNNVEDYEPVPLPFRSESYELDDPMHASMANSPSQVSTSQTTVASRSQDSLILSSDGDIDNSAGELRRMLDALHPTMGHLLPVFVHLGITSKAELRDVLLRSWLWMSDRLKSLVVEGMLDRTEEGTLIKWLEMFRSTQA